jgi:K+-sensing histidine kinase KdpD
MLTRLVDDLLDAARIHRGQMQLRRSSSTQSHAQIFVKLP